MWDSRVQHWPSWIIPEQLLREDCKGWLLFTAEKLPSEVYLWVEHLEHTRCHVPWWWVITSLEQEGVFVAQGQTEAASQKLLRFISLCFSNFLAKWWSGYWGLRRRPGCGRGLRVLPRHSYSGDDCVFQGHRQQASLLIKGATRTFPNKYQVLNLQKDLNLFLQGVGLLIGSKLWS